MAYAGDEKPDVAGVLADRLAATLVHHEPGWRLPRPSALARRYNVRPSQVEQAVRELAARHLVRQLPDGQLYRASPAEYLISMNGVPKLGAHVDPMGSDVTCRNRKVSWRRVPEDIGWALGIAAADHVCVIKCHWSVNGDPAAISTTYLTKGVAGRLSESVDQPVDQLFNAAAEVNDERGRVRFGQPAALHLEMQPPPSSVARGLRLRAGQPAAMLTVRFDEPVAGVPVAGVPVAGVPVALTVAALRPDLFRVVIDSPAQASTLRSVATSDAFDDAVAAPDNQADGALVAGHRQVTEPKITSLRP